MMAPGNLRNGGAAIDKCADRLSLYWGHEFSNFQKLVSQKFPFTPK
jgi:hypothetical protein